MDTLTTRPHRRMVAGQVCGASPHARACGVSVSVAARRPSSLAASDEAWRVHEMAAKVIAKHRIDDGLDAMIRLKGDPVPESEWRPSAQSRS